MRRPAALLRRQAMVARGAGAGAPRAGRRHRDDETIRHPPTLRRIDGSCCGWLNATSATCLAATLRVASLLPAEAQQWELGGWPGSEAVRPPGARDRAHSLRGSAASAAASTPAPWLPAQRRCGGLPSSSPIASRLHCCAPAAAVVGFVYAPCGRGRAQRARLPTMPALRADTANVPPPHATCVHSVARPDAAAAGSAQQSTLARHRTSADPTATLAGSSSCGALA
jgi:hypothetical protein